MTHRHITYPDGTPGEVDVVNGTRGSDELRVREVKTGDNSKWTPNQRNNIDALRTGNYYLHNVPGVDPTRTVAEQFGSRYSYQVIHTPNAHRPFEQ